MVCHTGLCHCVPLLTIYIWCQMCFVHGISGNTHQNISQCLAGWQTDNWLYIAKTLTLLLSWRLHVNNDVGDHYSHDGIYTEFSLSLVTFDHISRSKLNLFMIVSVTELDCEGGIIDMCPDFTKKLNFGFFLYTVCMRFL